MVERRAIALVDTSGSLPEKEFRAQVDARLRELRNLIAANTTADGTLSNRVTELEDAPPGYTAENARDDVGAALVAGTGISITVNDPANTITIDATGGVTDEHIQDVVGAMVTAGTGISVSYNDAGATETITCTITQYTDEMAQDACFGGSGAWVDGHGIDSTYNDGANTMTVAVDETELNYATPVAVGDALAAGSAATLVHSDHVHTLSWAGLLAAMTIYEIDFSTLSTNDFANGTESIDSVNWTCANRTAANVFEVTNGSGIRYTPSTSTAGTFLSGSQTSAYIYTTLDALFTRAGLTRAAQAAYALDVYYSALTREQSGETPVVAFWNSTATTMRGGALRIAAGPTYNIGSIQSSATYAGVDVGSTHNVISLFITPTGAGGIASGVWASGWPVTDIGLIHAAATGEAAFSRSDTRIALSMIQASDASVTTTYTLRQFRLRRVG